MITAGIFALILCAGLAVAFLAAVRVGNARRLFIQISWIPAAVLVVELLLSDALTRALGYAALLIPLLTCVASLVLTIAGVIFLASARAGHRYYPALIYATVISALPGALLAGYLLFS